MIPRKVMWDWKKYCESRWEDEDPASPVLCDLVQEPSSYAGQGFVVIYHKNWSGNRVEQDGVDKKYCGGYWNVHKDSIKELNFKPFSMKEKIILVDDREQVFP